MPPLEFAAVGMSLPQVFHDLTPQPEPRSMRFWHVLASQSLVGGLGWGYEVQRPFETNWGRYLMFFPMDFFNFSSLDRCGKREVHFLQIHIGSEEYFFPSKPNRLLCHSYNLCMKPSGEGTPW